MPNLGLTFKEEIVRLSRKVQRQAISPLQKSSAGYRRDIAQLKREVAALRRELVRLGRVATPAVESSAAGDAQPALRFQARGLKSMRARLGLSAEGLGRLVGVTSQTIYNWEFGKATPRRSQLPALAAIRGLGKKEVQRRLEAAAGKKAA